MNTIQIRDVSLFVKIVGQGYPVLLMHGGPGQDHASLLPLQPCGDQFTLIFYDHRCNGRSNGAEVSSMTFDNLTADAEALRQELGFEKWAVLGHSFGGNVALEYALRYPQSLSHLILMDTGGDVYWPQQHALKLLAKRGYSADAVEAARSFFSGQVTTSEYFSTAMKFLTAYLYRPSVLELAREAVFGPRVVFQPEATIFGFSKLLPGWTVMDRLKDIKAPALVMAGRHDFLYPPEHQAILADRLPNAQLELIECAGHNPLMEQPAAVIEAFRRFMATTDPRGGFHP